MSTVLSEGVVATWPNRIGPAWCWGFETGGWAEVLPDGVVIPAWLAPCLGAEEFAAESLDEAACSAEPFGEPVGERAGPEPEPRRWVDPTDALAGVAVAGSPMALGVVVDHPT